MRTAIVILNWNTVDYLEKFLPLLLSDIGEEDEVIVADNGSNDGSVEMMAKHFPTVRRIEFDRNYGFTGGYNKAFRSLQNDGFKYFLLINSDIEVTPGWLNPLVEWMENNPQCGACGPKLLSYYDHSSFEYAGAAGGLIDKYGYTFCRGRVMKMVEKDYGQYDSPKDVFWATGACLMVRSNLYAELGGLDERFFAHMEEIDLCWRLQLLGYKISVVPTSVVYHLGGGTLPNDSPWKLKLNFRNNLLMLSNNLARTYILDYKELPKEKAIANSLKKANRTILKRMILDGCSALVYLFTGKFKCFKAVLQAHKEYKSLRINADSKILENQYDNIENVNIIGMIDKWIIPKAILRKNQIFDYIHSL